jgi:pyruvate dehydrogenase E1 component beta subunit
VFLEQKLLYRKKGPVPEEEYTIPLSVGDMKREGKDLSIIAWGRMVPTVFEVAEKLAAEEGWQIEIVDPRTLMPLDRGIIISSVKKTGKAMVVHEAVTTGGYGGEIAAVIADSESFFYLDAPIRRVAGIDVPIPYNPELERNAVPTAERIEANIRDLLE